MNPPPSSLQYKESQGRLKTANWFPTSHKFSLTPPFNQTFLLSPSFTTIFNSCLKISCLMLIPSGETLATGFLLLQLWNLFLQMKNPSGSELCNFASYQHNSLRQFPRLSINHIAMNSAASNIHRFHVLLCQKYKLILLKGGSHEFGKKSFYSSVWHLSFCGLILSKSRLCAKRMYCGKGDPNLSP